MVQKTDNKMATGRDYRRPCQDKQEKCVFCENLVSQKNMRRHLTSSCEIAKDECQGKDILKEADLKLAKRKGFGDLKNIFQKSKSARTGNAGIASDHRPDGEELLLGDEDDDQMEVDYLNNQILNQSVYEEIQREELEEAEEEEANIQNPRDESVLLKKLEALNIGMSEGFNSIYQRLGEIEKEKRKELPPIAKPEDLGPEDERLWNLRKCRTLDDILDLFFELKLEYDDALPVLYCSLCIPEDSIKVETTGAQAKGVFRMTGPTLDRDGKMTREFSNLKFKISSHISRQCHTDAVELWRAREEEAQKEKTKTEVAGMRVGRIAYDGFLLGRSGANYEHEIAKGKLKKKLKDFQRCSPCHF